MTVDDDSITVPSCSGITPSEETVPSEDVAEPKSEDAVVDEVSELPPSRRSSMESEARETPSADARDSRSAEIS